MMITVLEATVAAERIPDLERAYRDAISQLTPGIVETLLVRDAREPALFQIVTVWESERALHAMRATEPKPKGVQIFESAGATPKLRMLNVVAHAQR